MCNDHAVNSKGSAGAPDAEIEIEVTRAMIRAGTGYLYNHALNTVTTMVDDPEFVVGFYRAIELARPD